MLTARFVQAPTDRIRYALDLSGWLAPLETLTKVEVSAPPDLFVTDVVVLPPADKSFEYYVSHAAPLYAWGTYRIKFESFTTDGQIRTDDVEIVIRTATSAAAGGCGGKAKPLPPPIDYEGELVGSLAIVADLEASTLPTTLKAIALRGGEIEGKGPHYRVRTAVETSDAVTDAAGSWWNAEGRLDARAVVKLDEADKPNEVRKKLTEFAWICADRKRRGFISGGGTFRLGAPEDTHGIELWPGTVWDMDDVTLLCSIVGVNGRDDKPFGTLLNHDYKGLPLYGTEINGLTLLRDQTEPGLYWEGNVWHCNGPIKIRRNKAIGYAAALASLGGRYFQGGGLWKLETTFHVFAGYTTIHCAPGLLLDAFDMGRRVEIWLFDGSGLVAFRGRISYIQLPGAGQDFCQIRLSTLSGEVLVAPYDGTGVAGWIDRPRDGPVLQDIEFINGFKHPSEEIGSAGIRFTHGPGSVINCKAFLSGDDAALQWCPFSSSNASVGWGVAHNIQRLGSVWARAILITAGPAHHRFVDGNPGAYPNGDQRNDGSAMWGDAFGIVVRGVNEMHAGGDGIKIWHVGHQSFLDGGGEGEPVPGQTDYGFLDNIVLDGINFYGGTYNTEGNSKGTVLIIDAAAPGAKIGRVETRGLNIHKQFGTAVRVTGDVEEYVDFGSSWAAPRITEYDADQEFPTFECVDTRARVYLHGTELFTPPNAPAIKTEGWIGDKGPRIRVLGSFIRSIPDVGAGMKFTGKTDFKVLGCDFYSESGTVENVHAIETVQETVEMRGVIGADNSYYNMVGLRRFGTQLGIIRDFSFVQPNLPFDPTIFILAVDEGKHWDVPEPYKRGVIRVSTGLDFCDVAFRANGGGVTKMGQFTATGTIFSIVQGTAGAINITASDGYVRIENKTAIEQDIYISYMSGSP